MVVILGSVAKKNARPEPGRRRTIPLFGSQYDWWPNAVEDRIAELGIDQKFLAAWIGSEYTAVHKCIKRKVPVYELLLDISDALDLPYPVVLPESYEEALKVARERRLQRRDAQMAQIKAGVGDSSEKRQIRAIQSSDVSRWKKEQGKTEEHQAQPSTRITR